MPASPDKMSAAARTHRRLARLAIAWFAVDAVQVEKTLRAVNESVARGENTDFLRALVDADVLSQKQAEQLRLDRPPSDAGEEESDQPRTTKLEAPAVYGAAEPTQIGVYRVLRKLGQGGMGAVYLAFDSKENRQVAVKVLAAEQAPKQNILRRFQLEGQHGALLSHDNIVRSYDMGQDQATGLHYIVLEYIDGLSAQELLDRTGKLQVGDALHIILDIARALEHAHKQQIIHRDIKPANILLTQSGLAKLSDLGLAKRRDDHANLTHATQGIGTPYYMPYEQAMNAKMADERSDIYALGATLFHLLTGEVPFQGDSALEIVEKKGLGSYPPAHSLNPDIPYRLEEIMAHMLARDPDNRYQTVSEVIVDLERTQLAAAIPSFVNVDFALQDPVVVQRLTAPIEATQPDMQLQQALAIQEVKDRPLWYLKYLDPRGNPCKSKATTAEIVARLKKGTIPLHTEASRSAQGKFKPLETWPDFQTAIAALPIAKKVEKHQEEPAVTSHTWWWVVAGAAGVSLVIGVAYWIVIAI